MIHAKDFAKVMDTILDLVPAVGAATSSQYVRLQMDDGALKASLTGTVAAEVQWPVQTTDRWTHFVDRRILASFSRTHRDKDDVVKLVQDSSRKLILSCGRHELKLDPIEPVSGYGEFEIVGNKVTFDDTLREVLVMMSQYAAQTLVAEHMTRVQLVKGFGILASDGFVVCCLLDKGKVKKSLAVPAAVSRLLERVPVEEIRMDEGNTYIRFDCGKAFIPAVVTERQFPLEQLQTVVTQVEQRRPAARFKASELVEALTLLESYVLQDPKAAQVRIRLNKRDGTATLVLRTTQGEVVETVSAEAEDDLEVICVLAKLIPWLEFLAKHDPEQSVELVVEPKLLVALLGRYHGERMILVQAEIMA